MVETQKWGLMLAAGLFVWLLVLLSPMLSPFILGALLAYLCDPIVERLQRWHVRRTIAVAFVVLGM